MKQLKPRNKRERQLVAQTQVAERSEVCRREAIEFERGVTNGAQQERKKIDSENQQQKFRTLVALAEQQIKAQSHFGQTIAQLVDLASRL